MSGGINTGAPAISDPTAVCDPREKVRMNFGETKLEPTDSALGATPPMSLSVILPNFNHAKLIPRALRAYLNQTPPAREIIVIDDGSTDDSVKIIEDFSRRYPAIRLIRHLRNRGVVAAIRSGLDVATGEYVLLGSSDDYVLPRLFGHADTELRANPLAALFCSGVALVSLDNRVIGLRPVTQPCRSRRYLSPADVRRAVRTTDFWFIGGSTVYRRQLLADIGDFDPRLGSITDTLTTRLLAFGHGFCYDPAVLGAYNKDPTSFSARNALSVEASLRLLGAADAWIAEKFAPEDRDEQRRLFGRRMRFGFARLWVVWRDGTLNTDAVSDILGFGPADRTVLAALARVPLVSGLLVLGWMTLRMRPFGALATVQAAWRHLCFKWFGRAAVQREVDEVCRPRVETPVRSVD